MTAAWVKIDELLTEVTTPDVLKWLKSHKIDLDGPHDINMSCSMLSKRDPPQKKHRFKKHSSEVRKACFVKFKSANDANKFVKKFNGKKFSIGECKDLKLSVARAKLPKSVSTNTKKQGEFRWLKVTNLKPDVNAKDLRNHFRKLTKNTLSPSKVHIRHSGASSIIAFVQMKSPKDAEAATKVMQMSTLKGKQIWSEKVEGEMRHQELRETSDGNVVIRNVPSRNFVKPIENMCKQYGTVQKTLRMWDREVFYGHAVRVRMSTLVEAQKVLNQLHGKEVEVNGAKWSLSTAWWSSKGTPAESMKKKKLKKAKAIKRKMMLAKLKMKKKAGGKKKAATEDAMKELMKLKNIKIADKSKSGKGKGKDKLTKKGKKQQKKNTGNQKGKKQQKKQQKKRGVKKSVKV